MDKALEEYLANIYTLSAIVSDLITLAIEVQVNAPELDPQPILLAAEKLARQADSGLDIVNMRKAGVV